MQTSVYYMQKNILTSFLLIFQFLKSTLKNPHMMKYERTKRLMTVKILFKVDDCFTPRIKSTEKINEDINLKF